MESIADRLKAMKISVTSPDNRIHATLIGQSNLSTEFRPGAYKQYDERSLEHQYSQTATLLWTGYRRGYEQVITAAGLQTVIDPEDEWDSRRREYQRVRRDTEGQGESPRGHVRVKTLALLRWQMRIKDGTLAQLPETEFISEVLAAVTVAIKDYRQASAALRAKYFGTGDGY